MGCGNAGPAPAINSSRLRLTMVTVIYSFPNVITYIYIPDFPGSQGSMEVYANKTEFSH